MNALQNPKSSKKVRGFYDSSLEVGWIVGQTAEWTTPTPNFPTQSPNHKLLVYLSAESVGGDARALTAGPVSLVSRLKESGATRIRPFLNGL